jgi:hypothetical protein
VRARLLGVDAGEWESFLRNTPHDFYHLPAYVALCASQEGGDPAALYIESAHGTMLIPLILRRIPAGGRDATSPYGYPGPIFTGGEQTLLSSALRAGMANLESAGIISCFFRLHPLLNPTPPEGVGTVVHHGDTVSVDLTLASDVQWSQTRRDHRSHIAKAIRAGYHVEFDATWTSLEAFQRLYRATMRRVSASTFYLFDDDYFEGLRAALGDRLRLCVVHINEAIAAAGLFVETSGIVQYHLSAMDVAYAREAPTKLMIHFVRTWATERGDRYLFLGGGVGGMNDSLLEFKAGFSPARHPYHTLRVVLRDGDYARLVAARSAALDPKQRDGFFPLYRMD